MIIIVLSFIENKKITVNTKTEMPNKPILDDKLATNNTNNTNNTILNASLVNLSDLIQKILEENKKIQESDINNLNSSHDIILSHNSYNSNIKNIEVNKKNNIINLKKNGNRNLSTSPHKNIYSNINLNTLANIKTNSNYKNFIGNVTEKSQWSPGQEEKISRSHEQSEYIENKNKIKSKIKNYNLNNKSMNSFEYKKNLYNSVWNKTKSEKRKNFFFNHLKNDIGLKKIKSNKILKSQTANKSKIENATTTDINKNKEKFKDSFINKNNKINYETNFRKSSLNLNNKSTNSNTNLNVRKRNQTNIKDKKSLTTYTTKSNVEIKNNQETIDNTEKNKEEKIKKLSLREKSYYILSNSPILHLKERILFGRSKNVRNIMTISEIMKKNEIFLRDKIKELEGRIAQCSKRINIIFNASKTAEINFNFILSKDEDDFKKFVFFAENEKERLEYYNYVKILYAILNENYDNIENKNLIEKLYVLINKKGFKTIKEYLYDMYFKKKEINNVIMNINKINNLVEEGKIDNKFTIKFCRFGLFTSFLVKEIIAYGNEMNNMIDLKSKTKDFIEVINDKLKLYKSANFLKKN